MLCEPFNLFDDKERLKVLEDQGKSTESKADMIASATQRTIEQEMEKDPAFYTKFSQMLADVLEALHQKRLKAIEALDKIKDIAIKVATRTDDSVPAELVTKDMARRFFGSIQADVATYTAGKPELASRIAMAIPRRISRLQIRDWRDNDDSIKKMRGAIDDIFFEIAEEEGIEIPLDVQDKMIDQCIEIAIANEDIAKDD
jgi:type I restriction enzyme, R subunit